jgi:hypothetical protein
MSRCDKNKINEIDSISSTSGLTATDDRAKAINFVFLGNNIQNANITYTSYTTLEIFRGLPLNILNQSN